MHELVGAVHEVTAEHEGLPAWVYGVAAFAVLMLLLFVVTRFNPDR